MAPQNRKRKSEEISDDQPGNSHNATTPTESPMKKKLKITQSQKQALIDNLQLEITERARSLRAHYALQATDLRARIERRVNRIPVGLRKATMGECLEKHAMAAEKPTSEAVPKATSRTKDHPLPAVPKVRSSGAPSPSRPTPRAVKRDVANLFQEVSDKENAPLPSNLDTVANPKNPKRGKAAAKANARATSRTAIVGQSSVLSPKSHNSRTLPRSPIKDANPPTSPSKTNPYVSRPTSPLKPASPLKTAASAATSAFTASIAGMVEQAKRGTATAKTAASRARTASKEKTANAAKMPPPPRPIMDRTASQASNHSSTSASSANTTVVTKKTTKGKTTVTATATTTKKAPASKGTAASTNKSAVASKKVIVAEPAAGRRVLRKKN